MAAAATQRYFQFRICWCQSIQKVKVYQQTKSRRHISFRGWDITIFVLEFYIWFWFRPRNLHLIVHQAAVFCPNRSTNCGNMTSYPFLKLAVAAAQYYFQFRICWCHCLQKVKVYQQTKFRWHISIHGWDIGLTTCGLEKQTSAILEFCIRFRSLPFCRNLRVILHQAAEFCPNRNTNCGNMTSYPFLKMAATAAQYYFRLRICWCRCFQYDKFYQQTKFRRDISIHGWDITISGLEKQTSAILEFYFRFRSRPFRRNRRVNLHRNAEFCPNRAMHGRIMTSYRFSRWRQSAMLYLVLGNGRPPTKCLLLSELGLQITCSSD